LLCVFWLLCALVTDFTLFFLCFFSVHFCLLLSHQGSNLVHMLADYLNDSPWRHGKRTKTALTASSDIRKVSYCAFRLNKIQGIEWCAPKWGQTTGRVQNPKTRAIFVHSLNSNAET